MTPSPPILRQIRDPKVRRNSPKLERGISFSPPPFSENSGKQDQEGDLLSRVHRHQRNKSSLQSIHADSPTARPKVEEWPSESRDSKCLKNGEVPGQTWGAL